MIKIAAFVIVEAIILALLGVLLFIALLYQPSWVWIAAPLIMAGGFLGIIFYARSNPKLARILVFACPLSYTLFLLGLGLSTQGITGGYFLTLAAYYAVGAALLWSHLWLNGRRAR